MVNLRKINNEAITKLNELRVEAARIYEQNKLIKEEKDQVQKELTELLQKVEVANKELKNLQDQKTKYTNLEIEIKSKNLEFDKVKQQIEDQLDNAEIREEKRLASLNVLIKQSSEKLSQIQIELSNKSEEKNSLINEIADIKTEKQQEINRLNKTIADLKASFAAEGKKIENERGSIQKERAALEREQRSIRDAEFLINILAKNNNTKIKWHEQSDL